MGEEWSPLAKLYDVIKVGSIDGTDTRPHDKALTRALTSKYRINKCIKSDPECTLFVARLHFNTDEQTLEKHFSKYGTIVSLRLVRDVLTALSKGYAFIEYKHKRIAQEVYERANHKVIDGSTVLVDYEFGRTLEGWKPRRLGGGFGGKKESGQLRFGCRDRPWKRPIKLSKDSTDTEGLHFNRSHESTHDHRYRSQRVETKSSRSDSCHSRH